MRFSNGFALLLPLSLLLPAVVGSNVTEVPPEETEETSDDRSAIGRPSGKQNRLDVLRQATISNSTTAERVGPCKCSGGICGCCSRILLDTFNQKACINVTYDPDEFSFTANVMMNDRILYTRTVSGKNPRPFCVPVPRIPAVRACMKLYNVYFQGRNVHACINMEGRFRDTTLFKVGLDCIRLGANGVAVVKPEDGGGLGQVQFLPGDDDDNDDNDDDDDEDNDEDDDDDDDDLLDY